MRLQALKPGSNSLGNEKKLRSSKKKNRQGSKHPQFFGKLTGANPVNAIVYDVGLDHECYFSRYLKIKQTKALKLRETQGGGT